MFVAYRLNIVCSDDQQSPLTDGIIDQMLRLLIIRDIQPEPTLGPSLLSTCLSTGLDSRLNVQRLHLSCSMQIVPTNQIDAHRIGRLDRLYQDLDKLHKLLLYPPVSTVRYPSPV